MNAQSIEYMIFPILQNRKVQTFIFSKPCLHIDIEMHKVATSNFHHFLKLTTLDSCLKFTPTIYEIFDEGL